MNGTSSRSFWKLLRHVRGQDGKSDSKAGCLFFLLLFGIGGYVGWCYFVPYWNHRLMQDFVKDAAVMDAFEKRKPTEESIAAAIKKKMKELGIRFADDSKEEKLEVLPKSELSWEVNLRYKQTVRVYGMEPKVQWYEINFDGTNLGEASKKKIAGADVPTDQ